jgi:hypothetical protein
MTLPFIQCFGFNFNDIAIIKPIERKGMIISLPSKILEYHVQSSTEMPPPMPGF